MTETRMQLEDWLDDLCVRFIINLPEEDLSSVARICFQVEEAQWFYEDFIRPLDPSLPSMSLRSFCLRIFQHCPLLSVFSNGDHMRAFEEFLAYKTRVPVRGAIMLNHAMDSVVLVKGWKKGANWSFPRGKINKDEDDLDCAVREVYEETGYDIKAAGLVPEDEDVKYVEVTMREQHMRLYVFRDVPMDTHFEPRTRKEISKIQWYRLSELPAFRRKGQQQAQDGAEAAINANKFYMVAPFLVPLKKWVLQQKKKDTQRAASNQFLAPPFPEDAFTEEETGTDRNAYTTQSESENKPMATPGLDTLEGATAALHRLLKIQPPTQGLQSTSTTQSPATQNSGEALLALLHGKTTNDVASNTRHQAPPHTPLDHTIILAPVPMTPHHHHPPRHPDLPFSSMPPPPLFPLQQFQGSHPYQLRQQQFMPQHGGTPSTQNIPMQHFPPPQPQNFAHHSEQSQQLQHPQPLPPQVQRAVFTGGQLHGPLVSQSINRQPNIQFSHNVPGTAQNPQFPNIHVPIISTSMTQAPPRLTSHSLALLNAFKNRDQATSGADDPADLPLRRFTETADVPPPHPEGLPGRHNPAEMSGDDMAPPPTQMSPVRSVPTEEHKSSLLNIFKTTTSKPALSNTAPIEAESVIHIHKVEQHYAATGHLASSTTDSKLQNGNSRTPKSTSPFRPVAILTRPTQQNSSSGPPSAGFETPKARVNGKSRQSRSPKRDQASPQPDKNLSKGFQPQILKRPQQSNKTLPTELAAPSPTTSTGLMLPPSLDRRPVQPAEHKQTLLSLFGKGPSAPSSSLLEPAKAPQVSEQPFEAVSAATRSRVGSLASAAGDQGASARRGSQTPTSPADKAFLLGYLDGITKNNGR